MTAAAPFDLDRTRSVFLAADRTREELDSDYSPGLFVDDLGAVIANWKERTAATKAAHSGRLHADLAYGPHPRERIDLYRSHSRSAPLLVYIHGGFWRQLSKEESGLIAGNWTAMGVHVAVLDYALAPDVTLPTIVDQVRRGLSWLVSQAEEFGFDPDRMLVCGHSAGAHLAAMSQVAGSGYDPPHVKGLLLLSGVFELAPVCRSYVNDTLGLAEADAPGMSPARLQPARSVPTIVAVGEREPVAFHEQSRLMASLWPRPEARSPFLLIPRRQHFDLLDDLAEPRSLIGQAATALLGI